MQVANQSRAYAPICHEISAVFTGFLSFTTPLVEYAVNTY